MKPKALMLLAVAVGCGLVAMLGVQQAMKGGQTQAAPIETAEVLVVLKDLKPGERLELDTNVKFAPVPLTTLASYKDDVVRKPEEFEERAALIPLTVNDIVRKTKLTEKGQYGASASIPKGMRVFTFSANDTHTHAGLLRPGDKVDVTVTFADRKGNMVTKVLLECIEVFATENKTVHSEEAKSEQRAKSVSLLVTPEQDPYVKIAQAKGQLALSLRHPDDDEVINPKGINSSIMEDLQQSIGNDDMPGYERRRMLMEEEEAAAEGKLEKDAEPPMTEPAPAAELIPDAQALPPAADTPAVPDNVQGFLKPGAGGVAAGKQAKRWTMKIYNGNEPTSVDLEDATPVEPEPAASQGVPGLLKSWWSSGQK